MELLRPTKTLHNTTKEICKINKQNYFSFRGKFGSVYICREKLTNLEFAAKVIRVKAGQKAEVLQEIDVMNELHHTKLLLLWDAFESTREIFLVMEL